MGFIFRVDCIYIFQKVYFWYIFVGLTNFVIFFLSLPLRSTRDNMFMKICTTHGKISNNTPETINHFLDINFKTIRKVNFISHSSQLGIFLIGEQQIHLRFADWFMW